MKMKSFRYIFPQAFKSVQLNGWMSFAAVMTVTISLFLCTFFWLLVMNINANARAFESDVRVLAYILDVVPESDYAAIEQRIRGIEGVASIEFIDKEAGLGIVGESLNTDLGETLGGANPLPDSFSIMASDKDYVASIASQVESIPQILSVRYGEESVDKLFQFTDTMRRVGLAIMVLLDIAAVVLVAMTIRLTVMARRKELMVMKWVGATNAFIRWPFFIEGLLLGLVGAVLAASLVIFSYQGAGQWLIDTVSFVTILDLREIWFNTCVFTVLAGVVMGVFGSLISLSRFLKV